MREIALRVGIQPASLYSHFRSKEDVLWHVCQWTVDHSTHLMDTVEARAKTPLERFVLFFHSFVVFHAEHRREALVTSTQWRSLNSERRSTATHHRQAYHDRVRGYVQAIDDVGMVRIQDIEKVTLALIDLNIGVATWYRPATHGAPDDLASNYVRLALNMLRFKTNGRLPAGVRHILESPSARDPESMLAGTVRPT